ncbi:hypothetical protein SRABI106_01849 [Rahnella aquatilis]|nr:hypothetical protein SRABI106_01849 [Rahnella aquatilis]
MADVEAFHTVNFRKIQCFCQFRQPLMDCRLLSQFGRQCSRGIGARQFQITGTVAPRLTLDLHFAPGQFAERIGQQIFFRQTEIQQNFAGQCPLLTALQIELSNEGLHHFAQIGAAWYFREITAAAQHFALTDKQNVQTCHT